jgi:hypothetical protein
MLCPRRLPRAQHAIVTASNSFVESLKKACCRVEKFGLMARFFDTRAATDRLAEVGPPDFVVTRFDFCLSLLTHLMRDPNSKVYFHHWQFATLCGYTWENGALRTSAAAYPKETKGSKGMVFGRKRFILKIEEGASAALVKLSRAANEFLREVFG